MQKLAFKGMEREVKQSNTTVEQQENRLTREQILTT